MRIVRGSELIRLGDGHLYCHVEWEEATSGQQQTWKFMASVRYVGMMDGVRKQKNTNILFLSQIDMRNMLCLEPGDKRLWCRQTIITFFPAQLLKNNKDPVTAATVACRHCIL